jgi:transcriptional regulator with XRE-family HTH domain
MKLHAPAARAIREARSLSVTHVAEKLSVSQGQVSNWEAGRRHPTDHQLYALAGLLDVPIAAITQTSAAA